MKYSQSPEINWESLLKRLTAVAFGWFGDRGCGNDESVLPGTGMSAKELAYSGTLEFIKKAGEYRPESDEDRFRLILRIMKRDFIDLVRQGREFRRTVILDASGDGDGRGEFENLPDPNDSFASAEAASVARSLYPLTDGEQELVDLIDAVARCGCRKREEIADLLSTSPGEITKRQKKLKYRRARRQRPAQVKLER
jgi:DNA-directed RNA polymerase specialized sigma24 family protein